VLLAQAKQEMPLMNVPSILQKVQSKMQAGEWKKYKNPLFVHRMHLIILFRSSSVFRYKLFQ
jgi:hypothetical protein